MMLIIDINCINRVVFLVYSQHILTSKLFVFPIALLLFQMCPNIQVKNICFLKMLVSQREAEPVNTLLRYIDNSQ